MLDSAFMVMYIPLTRAVFLISGRQRIQGVVYALSYHRQ